MKMMITRLLLLALVVSTTKAGILPPKQHVHITQDLGPDVNLMVHCKSKDDDLGVHYLGFRQEYEISFRLTFWGKTLFFCGFNGFDGKLEYFDIYKVKRDGECGNLHCRWLIKHDGPCRFNAETGQYDICFPWNPPAAAMEASTTFD
ncbi:Plant self-incompatibility protein S1 family [Quillaja saponaria]|uniref:S-protein homolog n=1 Tax=Quillaja saponaria TaxID=32244 RepID=A0AAD7QDV8_QUISA|nr:Plant self-incompatibility protein S1 family [Quillaja saponaria]